MSNFHIIFLLFFLIVQNTFADANATTVQESSYIDNSHQFISEQVLDLSKVIDTTVHDWVLYFDNNTTDANGEEMSMDVFFKNEKYIDDTDKAFVRLGLNSNFQSKANEDYTYALKAHIPLSRSKTKLNLFVKSSFNDHDDKEINNIANNPNDDNAKTEIGVNLFSSKFYNITPKYSAGIRSFDPFARARYKMAFEFDEWDIELSQFFKYSVEDEFSEGTKLYFDTKYEDSGLFRILLHRETRDVNTGMDYGLGLHYYLASMKNTAIRFSQNFTGNTKYTYIDDSVVPNIKKKHADINNYTTSVSLRQNILKEWIYYEVTPAVNFHKQYDYDVNYSLNFLLEFYFGRHK